MGYRRAILAALLLATACNNADFAGNSGKQGNAQAARPAPTGGPGNGPSANALGHPVPGQSGQIGNNTNMANGGLGTGTDGRINSQPNTTDGCLTSAADVYNIVLVFDASTSQTDSDPGNYRGAGGMTFIDKISDFASRNPATRMNVSVVKFNADASPGAHGWVPVTPQTKPYIAQDITDATTNLGLCTHYLPALQMASALLQQQGASPMVQRQRNFVAFMTDGEPNLPNSIESFVCATETLDVINSTVDQLVSSQGVAMIAVASGSVISPAGEAVVQSMAKPTVGLVDPKHVGIYARVASQFDMQNLGNILFTGIGGCN